MAEVLSTHHIYFSKQAYREGTVIAHFTDHETEAN